MERMAGRKAAPVSGGRLYLRHCRHCRVDQWFGRLTMTGHPELVEGSGSTI